MQKKTFYVLLLGLLWSLNNIYAQTSFKISGKVTDINSNPLPGTTVSEKNTTTTTTTDDNGNYELTVSRKGATLVATYVGYTTLESSANESTVNFILSPGSNNLEEVVITGYSAQKRENVTASVVTVGAKDLQKNVTSPSIGNLLQGKVAGVDVIASTGRPGDNPNIRIRGRSSIHSQISALWVVDGVIVHGTPNINPNDIETMSILKDGAATTQYGSRGTNGVVVVTTKRAKETGRGTISANVRAGVAELNQGNFKLMNGAQVYDYFGQFSDQSALPATIVPDLANRNFNWIKNGTHAGALTDASVSYTGRTDKASIYAGGNYYKEQGSVKGYEYQRLSGRLNIDYAITDRLTFKPKINATYTSTDSRQHSLYQMYLNLPWDNPIAADGRYKNPQAGGVEWFGRDNSNYLYDLQYNYGNSDIFDIQANMDFELKISNKFTFVSTNNGAFYTSNGLSYTDPQSNGGLANKGMISNSNAKRLVRFTNQMLRYNNNFGLHNVSAFTAFEYNDYVYQDMAATGKGIVPGSTILSSTSEPTGISGTKNDYSTQSAMLQAAYNYDNRYNFQASFRRDGSSRFGDEKRFGNFYALSGAWNIHNEKFFSINSFDYLRLKGSYGLVGNVPNALYGSYSVFNLNAQYNGVPSAVMGNLGNNLLTWESSKDANIGVELSLLNRVNIGVDVYNKNTNGLLYFVQLPSTAGWSGYYENIGAVRNRGIELAVGFNIFDQESAVQWRIDANIAKNRNRIMELADNKDQPAGNKRYSEGRDIDSWYMRKWAGIDPANGNPLWEIVNPDTKEITTTNNYNNATLQFVGTSTPDFFGGVSSSVEWKNISLNVNFAYNKGAYAYNSGRELFDSDGAYPYYNQMLLQNGWSRWTPENTTATHPKLVYNSQNNSNKTSSRYLEDASFIRLRNVSLAYRLPSSITERLRFKNIDVYVSGDNLWISTKFSGIDPEAALYGDATSQYPSPKRLVAGINISF